jgi:rare lipoprotein A
VAPPRILAVEPEDPIAQFAELAELAREETASVAAVTGNGGVFLQLASFSSRWNADSFKERISTELAEAGALLSVVGGAGRFRIHLGPYASAQDAIKAADRLSRQLKLKPIVVR